MFSGGANSTTLNTTSHLWSFFNRAALEYVKKGLVIEQLGDPVPLKQKFGKQATWVKYAKLPLITSATTEGTPPTPRAITSAQITAAVSQFKDAVQYTDFFEATAADNIVKNIKELVATQMAESLDYNCYASLVSALSDNINYPGTITALSDVDSADILTLNAALKQAAELKGNDVGPHSSGDYVMTIHPNQEYNFKTDSTAGGWADVHKYTDMGVKQIFNNELGKAYGIRFVSTTQITSTSSGTSGNATVYSNIIFGRQPFGTVKLDGFSMGVVLKGFGSAGTADPVDELATIGWKAYRAWPYFGGNSTVADPHRAILFKSA